jgi:hypothetical protein
MEQQGSQFQQNSVDSIVSSRWLSHRMRRQVAVANAAVPAENFALKEGTILELPGDGVRADHLEAVVWTLGRWRAKVLLYSKHGGDLQFPVGGDHTRREALEGEETDHCPLLQKYPESTNRC